MIEKIKSICLMLFLLFIPVSCDSGNYGYTDPQALNGDPPATDEDDGSDDEIVTVSPEWSLELSELVSETSGLILWNGGLWTINDDTDRRLYQIDTITGKLLKYEWLLGVVNRDWEDLAQDEEYIYVGDFGNNSGNRDDLHILRVEKRSLESGKASIDSISFAYSNQEDLTGTGLNQTEFDCEAFIVSSDSIYLFTKQWQSGYTSQYVLPKVPGNHIARYRSSFNTQGQVTGATFLEQEGLLVLCGYSGLIQPFLYLFHDYEEDNFFSGIQQRINMALPFHQIEAIASNDGIRYYLSNERTSAQSYINIAPKLHLFDLSEVLSPNLE
jgi:hypothetical protein